MAQSFTKAIYYFQKFLTKLRTGELKCEGYTPVPSAAVLEWLDLDRIDGLIIGAMLKSLHDESNLVSVSIRLLANRTNLSRKTIQQRIRMLVIHGLISEIRRAQGDKSGEYDLSGFCTKVMKLSSSAENAKGVRGATTSIRA